MYKIVGLEMIALDIVMYIGTISSFRNWCGKKFSPIVNWFSRFILSLKQKLLERYDNSVNLKKIISTFVLKFKDRHIQKKYKECEQNKHTHFSKLNLMTIACEVPFVLAAISMCTSPVYSFLQKVIVIVLSASPILFVRIGAFIYFNYCEWIEEFNDRDIGNRLVVLPVIPAITWIMFILPGKSVGSLDYCFFGISLVLAVFLIWRTLYEVLLKKKKIVTSDNEKADNSMTKYDLEIKWKFIIVQFCLQLMILCTFVLLINSENPQAFTETGTMEWYDIPYFVLITFSTVGYGDFAPQTPIAKFAVCVIILSSLMFLTTFIGSFWGQSDE